MYTFELIDQTGIVDILSDSEIDKLGSHLAELVRKSPNFVAIRFDEHSSAYGGRTVVLNKNRIKVIYIK
jgi:hypothetical protein